MKPSKPRRKTAGKTGTNTVKKTEKKTVRKKAASLRERAEDLLAKQKERLREVSAHDLKELVHELATHQIELEMQNEELRRAHVETEASRRKYSELYEFSPVGRFTFDKNGLVREVNHTAAAMLGIEKRSLVGRPAQDFIEPADRPVFRAHLAEVFRSQTRQDCELSLRTRKGTAVPVQFMSIGADSGAGRIDACQTAASDITRIKKAEEALRASERRERERAEELAAMLEAVPTPVIIVHDPDSTHMTGNRAADELLRQPRGAEASLSAPPEVKPRHFRAIKDGRELRLDELPAQRAARGEQVRDFEFSLVFDDGTTRHLLGYGTPLPDEQGRPRGAVHVLVDITERKRAEETLREHELRASALINAADESILLLGLHGEILAANTTAAHRLGMRVDEVVGKKWPDLLSRALVISRKEKLEEIVHTGGMLRFEDERAGMTFDHAVYPVRDSAGKITAAAIFSRDITARKKMEEALRQSEEQYRRIVETANEGIWVVDAGRKTTYVNEKMAEMLGTTVQEMTGTSGTAFLDAEGRALSDANIVKRRQGLAESYELKLVRKDNAPLWAFVNATPLFDSDGGFTGTLSMLTDITERKRAGDALRSAYNEMEHRVRERTAELARMNEAVAAERQRLYDVLETLPVYVVLLSKDYHVPFANRFFRERFGESHGRACYDYLFKRAEPCENCESFKAFKTNEPHRWAWTGPDNREYDIYDFPFTDTDGAPLVLEMGMDVTERNRAEAALRELNETLEQRVAERTESLRLSEENYHVLFESMVEGFALYELLYDGQGRPADWRVLEANEALTGHTGIPREQIIARRMSEVFPEEVQERLSRYAEVVRTQTPAEFEAYAKVSQRHLRVIAFPAGEHRFAVTVTDVTERKRAEEALRSAHTELEQRAFELDSVNRELEAFAYTVSHDLKSPLRSIDGFTRAIVEDYHDRLDEKGRDYLKRITSACQRMTQLIDAILSISRLTRAELWEKTVDLSGLAEISAHELKNREPSRTVEFVIAKGLKTQGDRNMLNMVIENLLDNAWKFTGRHQTARIEFGVVDRNGTPAYFVRDDGAGFDMQYAEKLYMPFQRLHTESEFPGLGIGLAIAQRIIMRHGGQIWAESAPEKGATFYFTL